MLLLLLLAGGAAAAPADSKPEAFAGGVLVTGAGGKTGSLIYKQLKAQGVKDLRASVYSLDKARSALGCTKCDASEGIFVGDVTKPETLAESFRGVKTVLCAVGASPGMNATLQQAVEFTGVENQIAALTAGNPGVEPTELTFVLCSSMGTTDPTPKPYEGGPILFWKLNAEAFLGSCGVTAVVVKPGGLLLVASTYNWDAEVTPFEEWIGGYKCPTSGENITTLEGMTNLLKTNFRRLDLGTELTEVKRDTLRSLRVDVSEVTVWERM